MFLFYFNLAASGAEILIANYHFRVPRQQKPRGSRGPMLLLRSGGFGRLARSSFEDPEAVGGPQHELSDFIGS